MPKPAGQQSLTHSWVRNPVKWADWGWRFCRELKVRLDMLPALILVHLGSETEGLGAQDWGNVHMGRQIPSPKAVGNVLLAFFSLVCPDHELCSHLHAAFPQGAGPKI